MCVIIIIMHTYIKSTFFNLKKGLSVSRIPYSVRFNAFACLVLWDLIIAIYSFANAVVLGAPVV